MQSGRMLIFGTGSGSETGSSQLGTGQVIVDFLSNCLSGPSKRLFEDYAIAEFYWRGDYVKHNAERAHMPVSKTTPGRLGARVIEPIRVAFRQRNDVGTQDEGTFAAQWLAYALPCQRFADALAGICA